MLTRRDFLQSVGVGAGLFSLAPLMQMAQATPATLAKRPNFIFILTDDMGWGDAKAFGHPYVKTPSLDRLTRESTRFTQFYVANPVCSPSRTAFMTGHFPARHNVHGHFADHEMNASRSMPDWLDPNAPFLPRMLKGAGYATGHFGKWHLGQGPGAPDPGAYGIDSHRTRGSNGPVLGAEDAKKYLAAQGKTLKGRDPINQYPYYWANTSRMIVDETLGFIRQHKTQPFYVNVWTSLPHAPLNPTPEQLAVYKDLDPDPNNPAFGKWFKEYLGNARDLKSQMKIFLASLTDLDTQIGRLLDGLKEMGLADNTVVFFSSDNGPEDYQIANAANAGVGSPGPGRGRKRSLYEGGVHSEFLVRWPGKVPAGREENKAVLGAVDFLPTVCALAGLKVPESAHPDGEDVSDILLGGLRPRRAPLYWEWLFPVWGPEYTSPQLAIREGPWKLLLNPDHSRIELYDIPADPGEEHNLAAAQPRVIEALASKALAWQKTLPPSPQRTHVPTPYPARGKRQAGAAARPDRIRRSRRPNRQNEGRSR